MNKLRIGVIPAAGSGTRMEYLGKMLPKTLLPLYNKPIIHLILQNMKKVGIEKVFVILNYKKEFVMDYLEEVKEDIGIELEYVYQRELTGIADSLLLVKERIKEPFIVELGDDCSITDSFMNLINLFFEKNAVVVEGIVEEPNEKVFKGTCCLELNEDKSIKKIEEKPEKYFSNLRGCGLYIFSPQIFDYMAKTPRSIRNEIEITDSIGLAAKDGRAFGEIINGVNINVNSCEDLLKAATIMKEKKE